MNHKSFISCLLLFWFGISPTFSQTTDIVYLNPPEIARLQQVINQYELAKHHQDSIFSLAKNQLKDLPRPLPKLYYEGLLQNNPDRIDTEKSLEDVDKVVNLLYGYYGSGNKDFAQKAKDYISAWSAVYKPNGNPINENKFVPMFWAYHLFKNHFSEEEKKQIEDWMIRIAQAQMSRTSTPNNNWEAKRLKLIAAVGCILYDQELMDYAIAGFKDYIHSAYYPDGTSNDLKDRDAMHYHVSGLKPTLGVFINGSQFDPAFDLYDYVAPNGASIQKSVDYVLPYALGEKTREEWTNSKVALDKKRAEAGLAEYQPGMLYDPEHAKPLFEWAGYYQPEWFSILLKDSEKNPYTATWLGLLNSPLIREKAYH